ncbi:hypothetical protein Nepgr_008032 [Nepenthes gracilis]|uniref:Uncharacterized protein n=1 Tax=Nepenthes gracilis TaxID=150966 RepID=A0AAD3XIU2_NEPGR|nr:hypothetical protein Nepgr_008032 [Nepenthes gracilis]
MEDLAVYSLSGWQCGAFRLLCPPFPGWLLGNELPFGSCTHPSRLWLMRTLALPISNPLQLRLLQAQMGFSLMRLVFLIVLVMMGVSLTAIVRVRSYGNLEGDKLEVAQVASQEALCSDHLASNQVLGDLDQVADLKHSHECCPAVTQSLGDSDVDDMVGLGPVLRKDVVAWLTPYDEVQLTLMWSWVVCIADAAILCWGVYSADLWSWCVIKLLMPLSLEVFLGRLSTATSLV